MSGSALDLSLIKHVDLGPPGFMWIFAVLDLVSAAMTLCLTLPARSAEGRPPFEEL